MLVTLGFAHCNDYDGAYFTWMNWQIQAMRELIPAGHDVEYVIVENCPQAPAAKALKDLIDSWSQGKGRVVIEEARGTSQSRNRIFKEAKGEVTIVGDCHILTLPGALLAMVKYFEEHGSDCGDLVSGPLLNDDLVNTSTHVEPTWGGEMHGQWGFNKEAYLKGKPFKIPGMGLGFFASRTNKWLGFNKWFRGFGGEELYIHRKVEQAGYDNVCIPEAPWIHRFTRVHGQPYVSSRWEKIRNYMLGRMETGDKLDDVYQEFVAAKLFTQEAWDYLFQDPVSRESPPDGMVWIPGREPCTSCGVQPTQLLPQPPLGSPIELIFAWACNTPRDLEEHLPKLYEYASRCDRVAAVTKRREAAVALLAAKPKDGVHVYSYERDPLYERLHEALHASEPKLTGVLEIAQGITAKVQDIPEVDLLFIDSIHTSAQLSEELEAYGPKVRKYIVMHDVALYGFQGEDGSKPGLLHAVINFVRNYPEWTVAYHTQKQYGLMVLTKVAEEKTTIPGAVSRVFNFIKHASAHLREGLPAADDDVFEKRLDLCAICPSRNGEHCGLCGCPLAAKAAWKDSICDIQTWSKAGL